MTVLIAYGSIEGQTKKVAKYVEDLIRDAGAKVTVFDTGDRSQEPALEAVDQVILAASVHERRHPKDFETFVFSNRKELAEKQVLLVSVSLKAAFENGQDEARDYVDEMLLRTGLEPTEVQLVAGAIRRSSYDFYASEVLRHVVLKGQRFDPNVRDYEFTDWDALGDGVKSFLQGPTD